MKFTRLAFMSLVALALAMPSMASAQDAESIYMRRPLPLNPSTTTQGFRWQTTSTVTDINGNPVDESSYCGPVQRRNTSICISESTGQQVASSYCGSTSRPPEVEEDYIGSTCSFSWVVGAWDEGLVRCVSAETQSRTVRCQNQDGAVVEDRFCTNAKPSTLRTVPDYSGCTGDTPSSTPTVKWGPWSYDQTCSATATKTRTGTCQVGGELAPASVCTDAGVALTETIQEANYTGCSYAWQSEAWSDWSTTCGTATRTRSVTCQRSDGSMVSDSSCNSRTKPTTSESASVTSGCSPNACFGTQKLLAAEDVMEKCQAFAVGLPSCPVGTTQGDPGSGTCVSSVESISGGGCAVRGFEALEANCNSGGGTGGATTGQGCQDECGEYRKDKEMWCTAGTDVLGQRTSECNNGSVSYVGTISGISCDSGGVYMCR